MSYRFLAPLWACVLAAGCHRAPAGGGEQKPPEVTVTQGVERQVTDFVEFTGRTEAVEAVEIRARVTGYLEKVLFQPGAEVKAGQLLFEIDRKLYQADFDKAELTQDALDMLAGLDPSLLGE